MANKVIVNYREIGMADFFPPGFWKVTVTAAMLVFAVVGLDLLLGARFMMFLGKTMNKQFRVDEVVVKTLAAIKKSSDQEFDTERSLLRGIGRFVASGILFTCVYLMLAFLLPRLS